jgi:hypothetical protein
MRIAVLGYGSLEDAVACRYETVGASAAVFTLRPGEDLETRTDGRPWVEIASDATDEAVGRALCSVVERHLRGEEPPARRSASEPPDDDAGPAKRRTPI